MRNRLCWRDAVVLGTGLLAMAGPVRAATLEDGAGRVELVADGTDKGTGILPGEPLTGGLRTGDGARARVATGAGGHLALDGSSRLDVKGDQFSLAKGKVVAETGAGKLAVQAGEGPVMVEGAGGAFEVSLSGRGEVKVTVQKGTAQVAVRGRSVDLTEGQNVSISRGSDLPSPKAPTPTPEPKADDKKADDKKPDDKKPELVAKADEKKSDEKKSDEKKSDEKKSDEKHDEPPAPTGPPKLDVEWKVSALSDTTAQIHGVTSGNAKVVINGAVKAKVRSNGKFEAKLELPAGESEVEVVATGPDGQETTLKQKVTFTPKPKEESKSGDGEKKSDDKKSDDKKATTKQESSGWE
jgi:hypothetical protein